MGYSIGVLVDRDWVKLGRITVLLVEASLQLADALTKALPRPQHEFLLEKYCAPQALDAPCRM